MNPYLTSQDEAKLIKPVIIKYNHTGVKCAIRCVWSVKGKHNVRHMARLVGKGLSGNTTICWVMHTSSVIQNTNTTFDVNLGIV